jgi:hypothetical protein
MKNSSTATRATTTPAHRVGENANPVTQRTIALPTSQTTATAPVR